MRIVFWTQGNVNVIFGKQFHNGARLLEITQLAKRNRDHIAKLYVAT